MFDGLVEYFRGKKILILGFGREGQSTYQWLRQVLPDQDIAIADQRALDADILVQDEHAQIVSGEKYLNGLVDYDIIMKSPGISLKDQDISKIRTKIKSQLELFLTYFSGCTIGVTGTKGKSTTSALIYRILQAQNCSSQLLGNIGMPIFEYLEEFTPETIAVLELSSHQLEFVQHSPHISLLLNIYPEHLDFYKSFDDYVRAKAQICAHQTKEDYCIYNADEGLVRDVAKKTAARQIGISMQNVAASVRKDGQTIYYNNEAIFVDDEPRILHGEYNLANISFALTAAKIMHLDLEKAAATVREFQTLHHRLEFVGEVNGVRYYDNSIGTIPQATIVAIQALGDVDTVIVGGMSRGVDQTPLIEFLRKGMVSHVVCMPETGKQIAAGLPEEIVEWADDLETAVYIAKRVTTKGKSCLLSPAAVSFGAFKNFEEKGDAFQKLVRSE